MPLINLPTRVTETTATCIDHIYSNISLPCRSGVIDLLVSDHHAIFCSYELINVKHNKTFNLKFRDHSLVCIEKLKIELSDALRNFNVYSGLSSNDRFKIFDNILNRIYVSNCPIKSKIIPIRRLQSPWMSPSLLKNVDEKHRLWRLSLSNPNYVRYYKNYSGTLKKTIFNAKKRYFENKFKFALDSKSTWKLINSLLKPEKSINSYKLNSNNVTVTNDLEISNIFNEYFSSVASNLASSIPNVPDDPIDYVDQTLNSFVYFPCDSDEISRAIGAFKS